MRANRYAGTNSWWLGHLQSNADVDNVFTEMAQVNMPSNYMFGRHG